jgi:hypothetical protein
MTVIQRKVVPAVGLALAVVVAVGCSSTTPKGQQLAANVTSTSAAPSTTTLLTTPLLKCPAHAPRVVAHHQRAGTVSTFVPGHPVALLACRYHGFNQPEPSGSLATSAHFAPGEIGAALNAAPPGVSDAFCPIDFGEKIVLIFGYRDGSRRMASIDTGGCRDATNGDRIISFAPVAVFTRLEAVLGHDHL